MQGARLMDNEYHCCEVICAGCGKRQSMRFLDKPRHWFSRRDEDGEQLACSRPCIDEAACKTGKTGVVMPF